MSRSTHCQAANLQPQKNVAQQWLDSLEEVPISGMITYIIYPLVNIHSLRTGKWPSRKSG